MAGERILVVDDEANIRDLLERVCSRDGYEVTTMQDGTSALAHLEKSAFDVAILDLNLPDIHGLELLRRARELDPLAEVIILTGYGDMQSALEALRLGAYDYLQKTDLDLQVLSHAISRALDRRRLARQNERLLGEIREANRELERRRRHQLEHIQDISKALTGALKPRDIAQIFVRSILNLIDCDGVGVLLWPRHDAQGPVAVLGARARLSSEVERDLVTAMYGHLAETHRPDLNAIKTEALQVEPNPQVDIESWDHYEFSLLAARDNPLGIVTLASHHNVPFSEEDLDIFGILVSQGSIALQSAYLFARMRELATKDSLTGLYNHGHFFELLELEIARCNRYGHDLAVIMLDVDKGQGLKYINDTYGHQAGDDLLRQLATILQLEVRSADIVARYGGDEFIILAPQIGQEGLTLGTRLCQTLRETSFTVAEKPQHITVSGGVAVFHSGQNLNAAEIVSLADEGLYMAKDRGGDQICIAPPPEKVVSQPELL